MTTTDDLVKRLNEALQGVSTPLMQGDNLAITLCGYFDDGEDDSEHDSGWSKAAIAGCNEVIEAIKLHYAPLATRIRELEAQLKARDDAVFNEGIAAAKQLCDEKSLEYSEPKEAFWSCSEPIAVRLSGLSAAISQLKRT